MCGTSFSFWRGICWETPPPPGRWRAPPPRPRRRWRGRTLRREGPGRRRGRQASGREGSVSGWRRRSRPCRSALAGTLVEEVRGGGETEES